MINFETANDQDVLDAMKDAFWKIQEDMQEKAADWPRRVSGYPSRSGTTCSCALIRNDRIYIAHVGDSRIILVRKTEAHVHLTTDHKASDPNEQARIQKAGGKILVIEGRLTLRYQRTIKEKSRTQHIETMIELETSRSLGDYWSYNEETQKYMVSPEPQCLVHVIDKNEDRVLIFQGTKAAMMPPNRIVRDVKNALQKMPSNFAQLLLRDARGSYGALQRDDMSIICVRFHNNDMKFPSELRPTLCACVLMAPSNDDIVNLTPLVCCPEKDQAAVRKVKSDRRTIAGHYYPLSQQSMPGTSQMGSSGPRIDTYHLSELKATTSGYTTPKERTPTSDKESRMLDILCTPLRKKPRPQALPLSPTAGKKVELQDRSPKPKPPSKRKLDFSSDEGTSG
ncbi:PPM-type phosphatase domain-containing protein [Aphelenchoides besseyi]|nr:PPM-type phosphatase domain-containing protein [Aphelenchoides besseyi]